jgi:hypothetical protein
VRRRCARHSLRPEQAKVPIAGRLPDGVLNRVIEGRTIFGAVVVLLAALAGCMTTPPVPSPTAGQPVAITDAGECRRLIEAVNLADDATIKAVEGCRFSPAGAEAAISVLASSTSPDALWAALWVYSASGSDAAPVQAFATSTDPTLRAMAAATLIALGDRSGLVAAQNLLAESGLLRGSFPPIPISSFVMATLTQYVVGADAPVSDGSGDVATDAQAWATWLGTHGDSLQFSDSDGVWRVP